MRRSETSNVSFAPCPGLADTERLTVSSIDLFVTYKCGLRCSHCFLGPLLDSKLDMPLHMAKSIVSMAHNWGTRQITFLGGEPTLYPHIIEALEFAMAEGFETRIVTNGQHGLTRILNKKWSSGQPFLAFSIDGASSEVHDSIRGKGTFDILVANIKKANQLGYRMGGILSIGRQNSEDYKDTLCLCSDLGFEYVNVHYITSRGFATQDSPLSIEDWDQVVSEIRILSPNISPVVRLENTYSLEPDQPFECAIRENDNLMVLPDSRVFRCMMFIDAPESHSFIWTKNGLRQNPLKTSEGCVAGCESTGSCPAFEFVNPNLSRQAKQMGRSIQCIYRKEEIFTKNPVACRQP